MQSIHPSAQAQDLQSSYRAGSLVVSAVFMAPRELVFAAWTDPAMLPLWWGCKDTVSVESIVEPWIGGRYEQRMQLNDSSEMLMGGVITAFIPPEHLAFTLVGQPVAGSPNMLCTVEFIERDENSTEVRLTQEGLPESMGHGVHAGWRHSFESLARALSGATV